jgi:glycosyltransferase involved in cell wall biosynthesis
MIILDFRNRKNIKDGCSRYTAMNLIITIPAYNEENSLGKVINEIPREIKGIDEIKILVIDDGSSDHTVAVALQAGADRILSHKHNMGLAKTFRDGLNEALEMGADIIVNTDADFQYNGTEIPKLIAPILEGDADIVLGDRQIDHLDHMPRGNFGEINSQPRLPADDRID